MKTEGALIGVPKILSKGVATGGKGEVTPRKVGFPKELDLQGFRPGNEGAVKQSGEKKEMYLIEMRDVKKRIEPINLNRDLSLLQCFTDSTKGS